VSDGGFESGEALCVPIVRHPDFYLFDGSVVLILEGTALRIHQSVLARHSEVFNGMWDVPQPSSSEKYDNCPCVYLSDSLEDFIEVAKVLYDPFHFDKVALETNFKELIMFISGILRISTKYNMQQIRNKCMSMIQDKFPSTLAGCDDVIKRKLLYSPSEIDRLIPLARETNIPHVLPWAFYLCTQMGPDDILKNTVLSWKDKALCLAGKECLWEAMKTLTHNFILRFTPAPYCTSNCRPRLPEAPSEALDVIEMLRKAPHVLEEYKDWAALRLCHKCQPFLQAQHRSGREKVWQSLPSFFQLGTWEDVMKEQGC